MELADYTWRQGGSNGPEANRRSHQAQQCAGLVRPFEFADSQRAFRIVARVMSLTDDEVDRARERTFTEFHGRHQKARQFILHRFEYAQQFLLTDAPVSENRQLLIGAYFTQEYALESAALFNPSMVWHPGPVGAAAGFEAVHPQPAGDRRRARLVDHLPLRRDRWRLQDRARSHAAFVTTPDMVPNTHYDKELFQRKLVELGFANGFVEQVMTLAGRPLHARAAANGGRARSAASNGCA